MTTALVKLGKRVRGYGVELFEQLYVPNISRAEAEQMLRGRREGTFILRDASCSPYTIPEGMTRIYSVSYWNFVSEGFNHLLICSDSLHLYWNVCIDTNEFQAYASLRDILYDVPCIRSTSMKYALVVGF